MEAPIPDWARTIGASLKAGASIRVLCTKCGKIRDLTQADLASLVERMGADFSLIGRRCLCRMTSGCKGWNRFYYLQATYRPLWTNADIRRWILSD